MARCASSRVTSVPGYPAQAFVLPDLRILVVDANSLSIYRDDHGVMTSSTKWLDGSVETGAGFLKRIEIRDLRAVANLEVVSMLGMISRTVSFASGGRFAYSLDRNGKITESVSRNTEAYHGMSGILRFDEQPLSPYPDAPPHIPIAEWRRLLPQVIARLKRNGQTAEPIIRTSFPDSVYGKDGKLLFTTNEVEPGEPPQIVPTELGILAFDETGVNMHRLDGSIAFKERNGDMRSSGEWVRRIELYDLAQVTTYDIIHASRTVSHTVGFANGGSFVVVMDDQAKVIETMERNVHTAREENGVIRVFGQSFPEEWNGIGSG